MTSPRRVTSKWTKAPPLTVGERWGGTRPASRLVGGAERPPVRSIGMVWRKPKRQGAGALLPVCVRTAAQPMLVRERLRTRIEVLHEHRIEWTRAPTSEGPAVAAAMTQLTAHHHLHLHPTSERTRTLTSEGPAAAAAMTQLTAHYHLHLNPASERSGAVGPGRPARSLAGGGARSVLPDALMHRPSPATAAQRREQGILAHAASSSLATRTVRRPHLGARRGVAVEGSAPWRPAPTGVQWRAPASEADPAQDFAPYKAPKRLRGRPSPARSAPAFRPRAAAPEVGGHWSGPEAAAMVWRARPGPRPAAQLSTGGEATPATATAARLHANTAAITGPAGALIAQSAAGPVPQLDPVIAERLAQDVMRRIERNLRIGRERRGI